jgi:hypothetical protein
VRDAQECQRCCDLRVLVVMCGNRGGGQRIALALRFLKLDLALENGLFQRRYLCVNQRHSILAHVNQKAVQTFPFCVS